MAATRPRRRRSQRDALLKQIAELAERSIFGTLSTTFRTCSTPGCHCRHGGPKHGPYLSISYRSGNKTTGFHVPARAAEKIRAGVDAWWKLQDCLRALAEMNKKRILDEAREGAEQ